MLSIARSFGQFDQSSIISFTDVRIQLNLRQKSIHDGANDSSYTIIVTWGTCWCQYEYFIHASIHAICIVRHRFPPMLLKVARMGGWFDQGASIHRRVSLVWYSAPSLSIFQQNGLLSVINRVSIMSSPGI